VNLADFIATEEGLSEFIHKMTKIEPKTSANSLVYEKRTQSLSLSSLFLISKASKFGRRSFSLREK
jgi:hypothetical protein